MMIKKIYAIHSELKNRILTQKTESEPPKKTIRIKKQNPDMPSRTAPLVYILVRGVRRVVVLVLIKLSWTFRAFPALLQPTTSPYNTNHTLGKSPTIHLYLSVLYGGKYKQMKV